MWQFYLSRTTTDNHHIDNHDIDNDYNNKNDDNYNHDNFNPKNFNDDNIENLYYNEWNYYYRSEFYDHFYVDNT